MQKTMEQKKFDGLLTEPPKMVCHTPGGYLFMVAIFTPSEILETSF
jgi:hypothetical protein